MNIRIINAAVNNRMNNLRLPFKRSSLMVCAKIETTKETIKNKQLKPASSSPETDVVGSEGP
jgi:hypothetical protein